MKRFTLLGLTIVCLGLVSNSLARPEMVQTMERIDFAGKSITLEGTTYRLSKDVRWYGLGETKPVDALPLMQGRRLGVEIDHSGAQPVVTEIWIQP